MTPPAPLTDDWLYWDPESVQTYPHSQRLWTGPREPEQLELFGLRNVECRRLSIGGADRVTRQARSTKACQPKR